MNDNIEEVQYGVGFIKGHVVTDEISLTDNSDRDTSTSFSFLSVFEANNIENIMQTDGLLGLSPSNSLINELKNNGIIEKAMFSMYLTDVS